MFEAGQPRTLSFYILAIIFGAFVAFLYGPMIVMYILAFQGPGGGMTFPLVGTSIHWFQAVLTGTDRMGDIPASFVRSIRLAVIVACINMVVCVAAGMGFRRNFWGSNIVFYMAVASIVVPSLFVGFGVALVFHLLGWPIQWFTSGLGAQLSWTLPFGLFILFATIGRFPRAYEEAATDLGASSWQRFRFVIVPIILPGIIGATFFGLTLSYDELARSNLTMGSENSLPMEISALMTDAQTPVLFALGTLTTIFSFLLIAVTMTAVSTVLRHRRSRRAVAGTA